MLQATNQVPTTTVSNPVATTTTVINPMTQIPANDSNTWVQANPIVTPIVQPQGKTFIFFIL
jgi:hypothetical protein